MANLIKVKLDETEIWIEAEGEVETEGEVAAPERVGVIGEALKRIPDRKHISIISFDKVSDTIRAYCTSLVKTFEDLKSEHAPDRLSAEFGLKISGEGNIYVVKSTAECSLKITVEWQIK